MHWVDLRVGYGIGDVSIIQNLYKLRPPFNVTTLSLEGGKVALKDEKFVQKCIKKNFKQMKRYEKFSQEKIFKIYPKLYKFYHYLYG